MILALMYAGQYNMMLLRDSRVLDSQCGTQGTMSLMELNFGGTHMPNTHSSPLSYLLSFSF